MKKTSSSSKASSAQAVNERLKALLTPNLAKSSPDVASKNYRLPSSQDNITARLRPLMSSSEVQPVALEPESLAKEGAKHEPKVYPVVVYTAEELDQAQKQGAEKIVVKGELAAKLHTALKGLKAIGAGSLNTLALCLSGAALLSPFTGGVTLGAAGTAMGTLGAALTATAIAAISAIGLALVIAVFKGYEEVKLGGGGMELVIKKKHSPKQER